MPGTPGQRNMFAGEAGSMAKKQRFATRRRGGPPRCTASKYPVWEAERNPSPRRPDDPNIAACGEDVDTQAARYLKAKVGFPDAERTLAPRRPSCGRTMPGRARCRHARSSAGPSLGGQVSGEGGTNQDTAVTLRRGPRCAGWEDISRPATMSEIHGVADSAYQPPKIAPARTRARQSR